MKQNYSLAFLKAYKPDEVKIISRQIKESDRSKKTAGLKFEHYQEHSLRSTEALTAKSNATNISDLLLAGRWSNEKTITKFFSKLCNEIPDFIIET